MNTKKIFAFTFAVAFMLTLCISIQPASALSRGSYTDWNWLWSDSTSLAIVLFGGYCNSPYTTIVTREPSDQDQGTAQAEYDFTEDLHLNGIDVIYPDQDMYYSTSDNDWVSNLAWIMKVYYDYDYIYLFGHSAGGLIVAYEIQKEDADDYYEAAVIASAPVNRGTYPTNYGVFYNTAQTAQYTVVPTAFICHQNDNITGNNPTIATQMNAYYTNMPGGVSKESHFNWGASGETYYAAHDVFPNDCLTCGKSVAEVAHDWYW